MTPDINFMRHRPPIRIKLVPSKQLKKAIESLGVAISGAALISSIAGYGALMLGRDVPTALGLGSLGSIGIAINEKLKE
ncbi:hypothetical protein IQ257_21165 [Coleofasciculus sp. LEGE 07092]|nr:hypothetical protein [Coleofasciculus sp. LEGE 07081]MBE9150952.1 hypothetical protein [Coleofasciculus sp. LEGE 07092]